MESNIRKEIDPNPPQPRAWALYKRGDEQEIGAKWANQSLPEGLALQWFIKAMVLLAFRQAIILKLPPGRLVLQLGGPAIAAVVDTGETGAAVGHAALTTSWCCNCTSRQWFTWACTLDGHLAQGYWCWCCRLHGGRLAMNFQASALLPCCGWAWAASAGCCS